MPVLVDEYLLALHALTLGESLIDGAFFQRIGTSIRPLVMDHVMERPI